MKKTLLLAAIALVLGSSTGAANGLVTTWQSCPEQTDAAKAVTFDCDPASGSSYDLIGTFSLSHAVAGIISIDGIVDLRFEGQTSVPAFWQLPPIGCNQSGLALIDIEPASCTAYASPFCAAGGACDALITGYAVDYKGPGTGRMLFTIARSSANPTSLAQEPAKYFGFDLRFNMDNAGFCAGCNTPTTIVWNTAVLYAASAGTGMEVAAAILTSADALSDPCVNANGGTSTGCATTPTRRSTWGSLKSLYR